jgi:hypothetical protein
LAVGGPGERPDVAVRRWLPELPADSAPALPPLAVDGLALPEPDEEVATLTLDAQTALYVTFQGRLVTAVELISPRNKDRPSARAVYLARYLSYLQEGVHFLLIDVHRRPTGFSFADALASELQIRRPPAPPPVAVGYRVGEPAASGGLLLGLWRWPLAVGQPLPMVALPLTVHVKIPLDLEGTYGRAAADAYLT